LIYINLLPVNCEKKYCFRHSSGEDIYLFTLRNAKGTEVGITNYGAIITSFRIIQKNEIANDIVLGFDRVEDYLSPEYLDRYCYFGAACGRYVNRIRHGRFSIDGKLYQLSQNISTHQLHGGHEGFDRKVWKLNSINDSSVELKYLSKDGEEGFPGNLETLMRFELNDKNEFSYEFTSVTDKPTAINLSHHSYFNLNNGRGSIENHEVKIYSSRILAQDEHLICNGNYIPVENTSRDFREFRRIGEQRDKEKGYDQCFEADNKTDAPGLIAEARSPESGLALQIFSTEPAVQFYTAQGLAALKGKNGTQYGPFSGFCLETHKHPNAVNIPHFPNTILRPGETYKSKTVYKILQTPEK
jgi:aldose 1-epimerase